MNKFTKAIAAIMLIVAAIIVTGCNKSDEPNNGGDNNGQNDNTIDLSGTLNGHDWVNLGLPSGTLWATCNVGSEAPDGCGDYFAWGETEPKASYNWGTYKYCNGNIHTLTKYCNNSNYGLDGFVDTLTILEAIDDAATANWGAGWCTPSKEQWQELRNNTTSIWTSLNGKEGQLFSAANGMSIFLPALGYCLNDEVHEFSSYGDYWSSSLGNDSSYNGVGVWYIYFFSEDYYMYYGSRSWGLSIRPVRSTE